MRGGERPGRAERRSASIRALPGLMALWALLVAAPAPAQEGPWVVPERRARQANPLTASEEVIEQGRQLYVRECASCHGTSGHNDGPRRPKDISSSRLHSDPSLWGDTDGALFWKVTEGRGSMPSMRDVLSDRERWMVVLYLRTLAPKPAGGTRPPPATMSETSNPRRQVSHE